MAHNDVIMSDVWSLREGMTLARPVEIEGSILIQKGMVLNEQRIRALRDRVVAGNDLSVFVVVDTKARLIKNMVERLMAYLDKEVYYPVLHNSVLKTKVEMILYSIIEKKSSIFEYFNDYLSNVDRKKALSSKVMLQPYEIVMHNIGTSILAVSAEIASSQQVKEEVLMEIGTASLLHDVALEYVEWGDTRPLRNHPLEAAENFQSLGENIMMGIKHHHEVDDGTGYPEGLTGGEIHEVAKSVRTYCAFDTLNHRFHKDIRPEFNLRDPKLKEISLFYALLEIANLYQEKKYHHPSVVKLLKLFNLQELGSNPALVSDLRKIPGICPGGFKTAIVDYIPGRRPTMVRCLNPYQVCNAAAKLGMKMRDPRSNFGIYNGIESYRCEPLTRFLEQVYESH